VPVGDEKILAEKIVLLLNDAALAQRMGKNGTENVRNFSAKGVAEKWQEIFVKYRK
jgi:glycosyltransferase involved in cell wall biosynthesis